MLLVPAMAGRTTLKSQEEEEEVTFLAVDDEDEVTVIPDTDSGTFYEVDEETTVVAEANEKLEELLDEDADVKITNLVEARTNLRFVGNAVQFRNPDQVEVLVNELKTQVMDNHP